MGESQRKALSVEDGSLRSPSEGGDTAQIPHPCGTTSRIVSYELLDLRPRALDLEP